MPVYRNASVQKRVKLILKGTDEETIERELRGLRKVMELCSDKFECRRFKLFHPFGGHNDKHCHQYCDNCVCRGEIQLEFKRVDVTRAVKTLLSHFQKMRRDKEVTARRFLDSCGKRIKVLKETDQLDITKERVPMGLLELLTLHMMQEGIFNMKLGRSFKNRVSNTS